MIFKPPHIIIVGAGIVGASLAYHLSRQQARVTLIDKAAEPANDVTGNSFGWITAAQDAPEAYVQLRHAAIADWHRVEDELTGQLNIDWSGALTWLDRAAATERTARKLIHSGHRVRLIDEQEIRLLEPNLKQVPAQAMFAEKEGAIDALFATKLLIKAARTSGADIQLGNEVLSFLTSGSRITGVVTAHGKVMADVVVLATGARSVSLCQSLGFALPVHVSPALLMKFHTHYRFVNRVVSNPFMEVRAASPTLLLAAGDYFDESPENNPQAIAQRTLETIKKHWQCADSIQLLNVSMGRRPIPQDGLPIMGRTANIDGLYLSVMHSGVTLTAIIGRLAAAELLSGQEDVLLSSYRLERFH